MAIKMPQKANNLNPSPKTRFTKENHPKSPGPKPNPIKLALKTLTPEGYSALIEELTKLDKGTLKKIYRNPESNGITALLARAIHWGDTAELEKILSRVIGSVPQKTELTGGNGQPLIPAVISIQPIKSLTKT